MTKNICKNCKFSKENYCNLWQANRNMYDNVCSYVVFEVSE